MTDLKLVIEDTIDNVATLQDCTMDQAESLQLLGELQHADSHHWTFLFLQMWFWLSNYDLQNLHSSARWQDDTRSGHHNRAEEHVIWDEGAAQPAGNLFCMLVLCLSLSWIATWMDSGAKYRKKIKWKGIRAFLTQSFNKQIYNDDVVYCFYGCFSECTLMLR